MGTSVKYIEFVCEQIDKHLSIRYRKMFGEYMLYLNDKPILLICDNTVFVKQHDALKSLMHEAKLAYPYPKSKLHYILDIEDRDLVSRVLAVLEPLTPLPKSKKKKVILT